MNPLDVAFGLGCILAALGGWRMGLIRRVLGWVGLAIGLAAASQLLPHIITTPDHPHHSTSSRASASSRSAGSQVRPSGSPWGRGYAG